MNEELLHKQIKITTVGMYRGFCGKIVDMTIRRTGLPVYQVQFPQGGSNWFCEGEFAIDDNVGDMMSEFLGIDNAST